MKDINLLQSYQKEKKQFDLARYRKRVLILTCVVVGVLGLCYGGMLYGVNYYNGKILALKEEAKTYAPVTDAKKAVSQTQAQIGRIESLLAAASGTSYVDTDFLWTLSSVLNENTFFTSLAINENATVGISGKSATRPEIANFLYNLKKTNLFSNVSLKMVNTEKQQDPNAEDTFDFTVTAAFAGGVAGE